MTPSRKPYGCVFCPIRFHSRATSCRGRCAPYGLTKPRVPSAAATPCDCHLEEGPAPVARIRVTERPVLQLVELQMNVARALGHARSATHCAWTPAPQVLIGPLIDARPAHVERVDVHRGILHLRVGERTRQHLLHVRRTRLRREVENL